MTNIDRVAVIGAGFIGKAVIRSFLKLGVGVSVLDHNDCPSEFVGRLHWIKGDLRDKRTLFCALKEAHVVYHLVSTTVPGDEQANVIKELNDNVVSSLRLVEACHEVGVKRLVFASSSSVYGYQKELPIHESASTDPISAHGIHKLTVEKYLMLEDYLKRLDVRILRIANPYGPDQCITGRQGFVAIVIGNILRGQPVFLRDQGRYVRDFIYIDDLADALVNAGTLDSLPKVMNIGSGSGHSLMSVVKLMESLIGRHISATMAEGRTVDIPTSILDIQTAYETMAFSPATPLLDGLRRTLSHHGIELVHDDAQTQETL